MGNTVLGVPICGGTARRGWGGTGWARRASLRAQGRGMRGLHTSSWVRCFCADSHRLIAIIFLSHLSSRASAPRLVALCTVWHGEGCAVLLPAVLACWMMQLQLTQIRPKTESRPRARRHRPSTVVAPATQGTGGEHHVPLGPWFAGCRAKLRCRADRADFCSFAETTDHTCQNERAANWNIRKWV